MSKMKTSLRILLLTQCYDYILGFQLFSSNPCSIICKGGNYIGHSNQNIIQPRLGIGLRTYSDSQQSASPSKSLSNASNENDAALGQKNDFAAQEITSSAATLNDLNINIDAHKEIASNASPASSTSTTSSSSSSTATAVTPLSMSISELSEKLEGKGRAQAAWSCYKLGIDPLLYYSDHHDPESDDDENDNVVPDHFLDQSVTRFYPTILPASQRKHIRNLLPPNRRTQGMGRKALDSLSSLYSTLPPSSPSSYNKLGRGIGIENSIAQLTQIQVSHDGTTKLLLSLTSDSTLVETVIIPWPERSKSTLCVSSQVGCRQGCTFCATGRMGKLRDLTSDEILIQVYYANKVCRVMQAANDHLNGDDDDSGDDDENSGSSEGATGLLYPVDNVVFMGMGEPSDNAPNVIKAATVMADRTLFDLAPSKITISTVAPTPHVFETLSSAPAVLAWSVHAVNDALRKILVPTTKYTMVELRDGLVVALKKRPKKMRSTMLEVTLIDKLNDGIKEAEELADFALEMMDLVEGMKLVVNLIPFNDIDGTSVGGNTALGGTDSVHRFRKPTIERTREFQKVLLGRGVKTYIRKTRGDDESAACGQLATKEKMMAEKKGLLTRQ